MKRIAEAGKIDAQGRLLLPMERVNQFAGQNKGARVLVTIEAAEPGSSVMQQAYYYKYIVPCVVDALREQGTRMTEERADDFLLRQYPADTENALSGGICLHETLHRMVFGNCHQANP